MGSSDERRSLVIRGRTISEADIEIVRELIAEHPQRGVTYLSCAVAERWGWRQPNGRVKDRACRAILAVLVLQRHFESICPYRVASRRPYTPHIGWNGANVAVVLVPRP